jgi:hypothetical protein
MPRREHVPLVSQEFWLRPSTPVARATEYPGNVE